MRLITSLLAVTTLSPSQLPAQNLGSRADSIMRAAEARGFSGVVSVVKDGSLVLEKGYGLANRAERIPFTPETVVQIGSNTKDFTAVSILQLQARKLLALTDSLGKFFPSAPPDKRAITVFQLLKHEFVTDHFASGQGSPTPQERLARIDTIHANQGAITIVEMNDFPEGPAEVAIRTEKEGGGKLLVDIDHAAPFRIRRLGIQIGGD